VIHIVFIIYLIFYCKNNRKIKHNEIKIKYGYCYEKSVYGMKKKEYGRARFENDCNILSTQKGNFYASKARKQKRSLKPDG